MLNIKLICVGNLKEKFFKDACKEYEKRLSTLCKFEIIEIPEAYCPDDNYIEKALDKEADMIIKAVGKATVIPLCIKAKQYSSENFSKLIDNSGSAVAFVIGSSHGLSHRVINLGKPMSVSEMTFPHMLFRVMMCEQIYRAMQIKLGGKYHK